MGNHGAKGFRHAVTGHHVTGQTGGALKVVAGTGGHLVHKHFFGDTATKQHADLTQHELFVVAVAILHGQAHGDTKSAATRNDGDLMHRVTLGQHLAKQRMA